MRGTKGRRRTPETGFTLVEMIVVLVIISILASLVMVGVMQAMEHSRMTSTESLVQTLQGAVESYETRWGDFPPSTLRAFGMSVPNDTNNGIEALVACLSSRQRGGILWQPSSDGLFGNTDRDQARKNPTDWYFGDLQLREVVDYFGRPLTYLHHRDYTKLPKDATKVVLVEGQAAQTLKAYVSPATKTFARPGKFQVVSAGKDGKLGTEDDIKGW